MSPDKQASVEQIPLYEVLVDWGGFSQLPPYDKESFIEIVEKMEHADWFSRSGRPKKEWACIDLDEYSDYEEVVKNLKKQGKAFYEGKKAENRGYYTKFFDQRTFVGDIVTINTSAPERQGRPMTDAYLRTVEQMGGYPTQIDQPVTPAQSVFWYRNFGTFRASPGHRQGSLAVDEQLVSYLVARRYGNFVHYATIIGHKDHLADGIVNKMHLDFVKAVLGARTQAEAGTVADVSLLGLRFICYAAYFGFAGLMRWKKRNLFRPGYFCFDFSPAIKGAEADRAGQIEIPAVSG